MPTLNDEIAALSTAFVELSKQIGRTPTNQTFKVTQLAAKLEEVALNLNTIEPGTADAMKSLAKRLR